MPPEPRITNPPKQDSLKKQAVYDAAHGASSGHPAPVGLVREQNGSSSERANAQTGVTAKKSSLSTHDERILVGVLSAYTVMATFWLLFATAVGVLMALVGHKPSNRLKTLVCGSLTHQARPV